MSTQLVKDDKHMQILYSKGMVKHGDKSINVMLKEYGQLGKGGKYIFIPQYTFNLTRREEKGTENHISHQKEEMWNNKGTNGCKWNCAKNLH